jgi:hypothetical protein
MREDCLVIATALHHRMERLSASALQDEVLTVIDLVSHLARNDLRLRVLRGEQAQIGHHRYARIRTTSSSELDILLSRSLKPNCPVRIFCAERANYFKEKGPSISARCKSTALLNSPYRKASSEGSSNCALTQALATRKKMAIC